MKSSSGASGQKNAMSVSNLLTVYRKNPNTEYIFGIRMPLAGELREFLLNMKTPNYCHV